MRLLVERPSLGPRELAPARRTLTPQAGEAAVRPLLKLLSRAREDAREEISRPGGAAVVAELVHSANDAPTTDVIDDWLTRA